MEGEQIDIWVIRIEVGREREREIGRGREGGREREGGGAINRE